MGIHSFGGGAVFTCTDRDCPGIEAHYVKEKNMSITKELAQKAKDILSKTLTSAALGLAKDGDNYVVAVRFDDQAKADATTVPADVKVGEDTVKTQVQVTGKIEAQTDKGVNTGT